MSFPSNIYIKKLKRWAVIYDRERCFTEKETRWYDMQYNTQQKSVSQNLTVTFVYGYLLIVTQNYTKSASSKKTYSLYWYNVCAFYLFLARTRILSDIVAYCPCKRLLQIICTDNSYLIEASYTKYYDISSIYACRIFPGTVLLT